MVTTNTLPDIGVDVPMPDELNLANLKNLSVGQLAYLNLAVATEMSQRMADPATAHAFAQYTRVSGADWSGHEPVIHDATTDYAFSQDAADEAPTHSDGTAVIPPRPLPTAPDCLYDTVPKIAEMVQRVHHLQEATVTSFARQLQPMFGSQPEYFGSPEGVTAFKDSTSYFKEVLRFSRQATKKIHDRMSYVTWNPGQDPTMGVHQPKLVKLATAFAEGSIPAENLDRIIWLDQDLSKYVQKTSATAETKDAILQEFESTLIEAAESSNPDAFNAARRRWANKIAHSLDPDGPAIAHTLRKKADNVIRDQAYADGSGKIWLHATPDVFAEYKNFVVNQLNNSGAPLKVDDKYTDWLFNPAYDEQADSPSADSAHDQTTHHEQEEPREGLFEDVEADYPLNKATLDDLEIDRDPKSVVATDEDGNPVTQDTVDAIEKLTPGQLLSALLIGAFKAVLTMKPGELEIKKSHGAASTVVVVQDIETAYKTLGVGTIPTEAQRPRGPHGIVPTVLKRPNPDRTNGIHCNIPEHQHGHSPPPWTGYLSEALNIGALHPKDAEHLACDSQFVGQIWDNHHSVLNQRRAQRSFTSAQRRAILARDRGCQAPGCTMTAAFCQIHHLKPWELGGNTDVDNAISLCAFHHGAVHNGKWAIRTINGTHYFQPAAWLDSSQPLLRNMYWAI